MKTKNTLDQTENKPSPKYFYAMATIFILAIISGYLIGSRQPQVAEETVGQSFSSFSFLQDLPTFYVFLVIFINNALKAFLALTLGVFFGIVPLYFILVNGYLIGLVSALTVPRIGAATTLAGLIPHGITELIALVLSAGYGLWLGIKVIRRIIYKEPLREAVRYAIMQYIRVILPLLFVSALIEAYITPLILGSGF